MHPPTDDCLAHHQWDATLGPTVVPLFLGLQWAHAQSMQVMRPTLQAHALSVAEFDVLATLRNAPAPHVLTPSELQSQMVITSGGLTKVLHQLEVRKLVSRPAHTRDQRIKPVRLSKSGALAIEKAMTDMVAVTGDWMRAALSTHDMASLTPLLMKLATARV